MPLLYENDFTVSKGAFVLSNTGTINQGWIIDPPLDLPEIINYTPSILSYTPDDIIDTFNEVVGLIDEVAIENIIESEDLSLLDLNNIGVYTDIIYDSLIRSTTSISLETTNFAIKTNSIDIEMNNFIGTYIDPIDNLYMNNADINNIIVIFENDVGSDYEKMVPTTDINNIEYFSTFSKDSASTSSLAYLKIRRMLAFSEMVHISYEADTTYYPSADGSVSMVIYDKSQYINDSTIDSAGEILGKRTIKINIINEPEVAGSYDSTFTIQQTIYIDKPNISITESSNAIYLPYNYDRNEYTLDPLADKLSFTWHLPSNLLVDVDATYNDAQNRILLTNTNAPIANINTLVSNGKIKFNYMLTKIADNSLLDRIYEITFKER